MRSRRWWALAALCVAVGLGVALGWPDAERPRGEPRRALSRFGQPEVAPARVVGRVTAGGRPVAGARVSLSSVATRAGLADERSTDTDASGAFDLGLEPPEPVSLRVQADGWASALVVVDLREPDRAAIEVGLEPCWALSGTVTDPDGAPIPDAQVGRFVEDELVGAWAWAPSSSDAEGGFELCLPPGGRHLVRAAAPGRAAAVAAVLTDVAGPPPLRLMLAPEASVRVRTVDPSGRPVPDVIVFAAAVRSSAIADTLAGHTDERGEATLRGLAPGRYRAWGAARAWRSTSEADFVVARGAARVVEIPVRSAGTLRGRVVKADADEGAAPVAGARVAVWAYERQVRFFADAVSQADGSFVLSGVPRGPSLPLFLPGLAIESEPGVRLGGPEAELQVAVAPAVRLRGVVRDADGAPVSRATVRVQSALGQVLGETGSDGRGRFDLRLTPLGAGEARLEALAPDLRHGGQVVIADLAGEPPAEIEVALTTPRRVVRGRLVDERGDAVWGAAVVLGPETPGPLPEGAGGWVAPDGAFSFPAPPAGSAGYTLGVEGAVGALPFASPPASATDAPLTLVTSIPRRALRGRLATAAGEPVAGAALQLLPAPGRLGSAGPPSEPAAAVSDREGRFAFLGLLAGDYRLAFMGDEGVWGGARVEIGEADVDLTISPPPVGALEGTLEGFPRDTIVQILFGTLAPDALRATVVGDRFRLEGLTPGHYVVTAIGRGALGDAEVEVTPGVPTHVALTASSRGRIEGRVVDAVSAQPIAGMWCMWQMVNPDETFATPAHVELGAATDHEGRFELPVPAGTVNVFCAANGAAQTHQPAQRNVSVPAGARVEAELRADPWGADASR